MLTRLALTLLPLALQATPAPQPKFPTPTTQTAPAPQTVVLAAHTSAGCPIGLSVRRANIGSVIQTRDAAASTQPRLHLRFVSGKRLVTEATLVLHGPTSDPHEELLAAGSRADTDQSHPIHLRRTSGLRETDVSTPSFPNVRYVTIDSLTFADGATWHESTTEHCSFEPDGYVFADDTRP